MTDDIAEVELLDKSEEDASLFGFEEAPVTDARTRGMPEPQTAVSPELLKQIIEGAILAANQPLSVNRIIELFEEEFAPTKEAVLAALNELVAANEGRGFELKEVASGWRYQVRDSLAPWVNRLWDEKPQRYSRALLETLSLIAYRQPITRGDIEEIRGVAVSSHIIKTLLERDWIKVVGQRDVPGRPSLYATTRQFLDYFNLKSLEELPSLSEIRDLDEIAPQLDLAEPEPNLDQAVAQAEVNNLEGEESSSAENVSAEEDPILENTLDNHQADEHREMQPRDEVYDELPTEETIDRI
ncbi:MAG: SMC-Scp complex subunit ScpB [Cellvibrio sp.]